MDESHCNPLKVWHDLGEPANLTKEETALLQQAAQPFVETKHLYPENGTVESSIYIEENGVVYFEWKPVKVHSDRGYSYQRVMQYNK